MRKTRCQKDGCSSQRVSFIRTWITLYSYTLGLMYASVHLLLHKKSNLLFIAKYFIFYDFSRKYLCKTWWYHESFRNQMVYFLKFHLSINDKMFYLLKLVSRPLLVKIGSLIEGESDFKNSFKISSSRTTLNKSNKSFL